MKRSFVPRKLKKGLYWEKKCWERYEDTYNAIWDKLGFDHSEIINSRATHNEHAQLVERLTFQALPKHRISKWQRKAISIRDNWIWEESYYDPNKDDIKAIGKYTDMVNAEWNKLTKDW